jgi:hypothetical protein
MFYELYKCTNGHKWLVSLNQLEDEMITNKSITMKCPICNEKNFEMLDAIEMQETKINLMEVVKC